MLSFSVYRPWKVFFFSETFILQMKIDAKRWTCLELYDNF